MYLGRPWGSAPGVVGGGGGQAGRVLAQHHHHVPLHQREHHSRVARGEACHLLADGRVKDEDQDAAEDEVDGSGEDRDGIEAVCGRRT